MATFKLSNVEKPFNFKRQDKDEGRPKRKRITPDQLHILTELFQQTDTPNHDLREKIAKKLNMTNREVQVWFQNRRAKVNRLRLQQQQQQQQHPPPPQQQQDPSVPFTGDPNDNNNNVHPLTMNNHSYNHPKRVKFNYWSKTAIPTTTTTTTTPKITTPPLTPPITAAMANTNHSNTATTTSTSSSASSLLSSPILPNELIFHPNVTPIDILASAAAYVQQQDELEKNLKKRKLTAEEEHPPSHLPPPPSPQQQQTVKKYKTWRPWL